MCKKLEENSREGPKVSLENGCLAREGREIALVPAVCKFIPGALQKCEKVAVRFLVDIPGF